MLPAGPRYGFCIGTGYTGRKTAEKKAQKLEENDDSCTNVVEKNRNRDLNSGICTVFLKEIDLDRSREPEPC